jgi:hypothetical protein
MAFPCVAALRTASETHQPSAEEAMVFFGYRVPNDLKAETGTADPEQLEDKAAGATARQLTAMVDASTPISGSSLN